MLGKNKILRLQCEAENLKLSSTVLTPSPFGRAIIYLTNHPVREMMMGIVHLQATAWIFCRSGIPDRMKL